MLIPTTSPWEVAAGLRFAGWNTSPRARRRASAWRERFGAEPVCARHDVLEFAVVPPPADRDAGLALARAQMAYGFDIVEQGRAGARRDAARR